jgi:hypothetical protein
MTYKNIGAAKMLVLKTSTMPPSKIPLIESFFTESPPQTMKPA